MTSNILGSPSHQAPAQSLRQQINCSPRTLTEFILIKPAAYSNPLMSIFLRIIRANPHFYVTNYNPINL